MKRTLSIAMLLTLSLVLCMALMAGCMAEEEKTSPTPTPNANNSATPVPGTATPDALTPGSPAPNGNNAIGGNTGDNNTMGDKNSTGLDPAGIVQDIDGFEEGKIITQTDVPAITQVVKEKYKDAQIAGITHAMRDGRQTYCVVVRTADEQSLKIFVAADGTIVDTESGDLTTDDANQNAGGNTGSTGANATQSSGDTGGTDSGANAK